MATNKMTMINARITLFVATLLAMPVRIFLPLTILSSIRPSYRIVVSNAFVGHNVHYL
jgi:hypothetical protein